MCYMGRALKLQIDKYRVGHVIISSLNIFSMQTNFYTIKWIEISDNLNLQQRDEQQTTNTKTRFELSPHIFAIRVLFEPSSIK